jgi:phosphoribosylformylglycinamidine cyclo-ligase
MSLYSKRGVSAQKEEVHAATEKLDKGLYPYAFCKVYPDYLAGDDNWVNIMHADGAGTKSVLAYLYWKETGDVSIWKGIARDAVVMNLDDLLCIGVHDNLLFSSTIDRNKTNIPTEVLKNIIDGTQEFFEELRKFEVNIHFLGGETADVGDVVRTIAVNGTMTSRWRKKDLITNQKIKPGDVIVGFASFGKSTYEREYNSGIGSNGLTSARHDILNNYYSKAFPESFDSSLGNKLAYIGEHRLSDKSPTPGDESINIGKLLLSSTRTYAPLMKVILMDFFESIHGIVHCSGGGQTKCMKYLPGNFKIIKDNLFDPPSIFNLIKKSSGSDNREMYQVFNMGHRLEIFTNVKAADSMITTANQFGIDARIVGHVEAANKKEMHLLIGNEGIFY